MDNVLEFQIAGSLYTGDKKVSVDDLSDEFVAFVESKGWQFLGVIGPLEDEEDISKKEV